MTSQCSEEPPGECLMPWNEAVSPVVQRYLQAEIDFGFLCRRVGPGDRTPALRCRLSTNVPVALEAESNIFCEITA